MQSGTRLPLSAVLKATRDADVAGSLFREVQGIPVTGGAGKERVGVDR